MASRGDFRSVESHGERGRVGTHHDEVRLGEREREVLEVLWSLGSATVQQVTESLQASLAYTTVMTTLDRLFKKGLLLREKRDRAFLYTPALTPDALEHSHANAMVRRFFDDSQSDDGVLLSCLVDAVQSYDSELLSRLEEMVRIAKQQVSAVPEDQKKGECE